MVELGMDAMSLVANWFFVPMLLVAVLVFASVLGELVRESRS